VLASGYQEILCFLFLAALLNQRMFALNAAKVLRVSSFCLFLLIKVIL
jgi:hypothetical protein